MQSKKGKGGRESCAEVKSAARKLRDARGRVVRGACGEALKIARSPPRQRADWRGAGEGSPWLPAALGKSNPHFNEAAQGRSRTGRVRRG